MKVCGAYVCVWVCLCACMHTCVFAHVHALKIKKKGKKGTFIICVNNIHVHIFTFFLVVFLSLLIFGPLTSVRREVVKLLTYFWQRVGGEDVSSVIHFFAIDRGGKKSNKSRQYKKDKCIRLTAIQFAMVKNCWTLICLHFEDIYCSWFLFFFLIFFSFLFCCCLCHLYPHFTDFKWTSFLMCMFYLGLVQCIWVVSNSSRLVSAWIPVVPLCTLPPLHLSLWTVVLH